MRGRVDSVAIVAIVTIVAIVAIAAIAASNQDDASDVRLARSNASLTTSHKNYNGPIFEPPAPARPRKSNLQLLIINMSENLFMCLVQNILCY